MTLRPENLPSTPRAEYLAAAPDIDLVRDLLAGTRQMQAVATARDYLPKFPAEEPENYKIRLKAAKVYGGFSRTLSAAVGMLFAKAPEIDERLRVGGTLAEQWANLDLQGNAGEVVVKRFAEDAMADGFGAIVVDFPPVPATADRTAATEVALNLRPYWRRYQRADILSWRVGTVNNRVVPTQVVLREAVTLEVGEFGTGTQTQYRVMQIVMVRDEATGNPVPVATWRLLLERKDGTTAATVEVAARGFYVGRDGVPFDELPIAVGYAGRTNAPFTAQPPLLEVAWANLYYWRKETAYNDHNEITSFPLLHTEGVAVDAKGLPTPLKLGPRARVDTQGGGTVEWVERTGGAAEILVTAMEREKRDMAELGMSFLAGDTRGVETAEAKRLDATAENATLATAATGIEDAINLAAVFHARYLGVPSAEAPTVRINRDFENVVMDAATMVAYVTAVEKAGLPAETLLAAWQRGGRIAADVDVTLLARTMMAEMQAKADAAAVDAELRADALANREAA